MLKAVRNPQGEWIRFEYDALGRRTAKIVHTKIYRYLWDGNVLLHEWHYQHARRPKAITDELGMLMLDRPEPVENLTTWVYEEGSLVPTAKLCEGKSYSIVSDYLGRPAQAYDDKGELVWQVEFDIYGRIREDTFNNQPFIPFRQLGQYEDVETGLYYNRFRYYDSNTGTYISQDPIKLAGNNPNFYAYVHDSNVWVDPFGLMAKGGEDTSYYRWLSEADAANIKAGTGIQPRGTGTGSGKILEHVQGKTDTGYISMSKGKLDATYDGGFGAVRINPDKVPSVVQHENVIQAVKKDPLALRNATRANEVLSKGAILQDAIEVLDDSEIAKITKCK
ncbi:hypothetical protein GQ592_09265 [Gilliamella sp. Lep-s21]|nr:hypothetical protein [Gilliamella sp. Lep-s35]MWP69609.1 hypothetical protein [Gilliamella sp. Lep-s5]MWP77900.1 hypothetical protein [Gilliamella sp. Lep-s21]